MGTSKQRTNRRKDYEPSYKSGQGQSTKQPRQTAQSKKNETENTPRTAAASLPSLPIPLQQLILNVFRTSLLSPERSSITESESDPPIDTEPSPSLAEQIQTIKAHLYRRDFERAFAEADEGALRAYAVRWSAGRALGYASVFWALRDVLFSSGVDAGAGGSGSESGVDVVCVGGGAGAEIIALAGVRRAMWEERKADEDDERRCYGVKVTAVDIADWSGVIGRLETGMRSKAVPSGKSFPAPLLPDAGGEERFSVQFRKEDALSLSEEEIGSLLHPSSVGNTTLVTLMFTLNELFSTSMPKTVTFLLRLTDLLRPGAVLLIVDSPGSYSTVALKPKTATTISTTVPEQQGESQRKYPMRFLLEHTLLSVASGKWECVLSEESRWFRRDRSALSYDVGEGIGLEDMRYQIHIYRRLG